MKPLIKQTLTAAAVIAVVAVLGYLDHRLTPIGSWQCENGSWRKIGQPKGLPPETGCVAPVVHAAPAALPSCDTLITKDAKADEDLWRSGRLGRHERCMKDDTWYLKYSLPDGSPRLLELVFAADADCAVDDVKADCTQMNPPSGSKTVMNGVSDGATLSVSRLKFITK